MGLYVVEAPPLCCGVVHYMEHYGFHVSKKTVYRDVKLLKRAGILQVYYSQKEKAYIPADGDIMHGSCTTLNSEREFLSPILPEGKNQRFYMERIIRLCRIMVQVIWDEIEDPLGWYRRNYPQLSDRTCQRDFELLREIDYKMEYLPEDEDGPGGYYYEYPGRGYLSPPKWLQRKHDLKLLLVIFIKKYKIFNTIRRKPNEMPSV